MPRTDGGALGAARILAAASRGVSTPGKCSGGAAADSDKQMLQAGDGLAAS